MTADDDGDNDNDRDSDYVDDNGDAKHDGTLRLVLIWPWLCQNEIWLSFTSSINSISKSMA